MNFLRQPNILGKKNLEGIKQVFSQKHDGVALLDYNPVIVYSMASSLNNDNVTSSDLIKINDYLAELGKNFLSIHDFLRLYIVLVKK